MIYWILVTKPVVNWLFRDSPIAMQLAEGTGGRVIHVSNINQAHIAVRQISEELRSQYLLGYTPSNERHDGSYRRIEVRAGKKYQVRARPGYFAAEHWQR
jgi:VWFA-related protein